MSDYKISLGVSLDTSDLKTEINKVDDKYKVKLGVDLKVNDIRDRITQYNKNTNNAKLKLGVKLDTDDLKRQIKQLNLSTSGDKGVDITVNTESLERSLTEVKGLITDIKNTLGTLDNSGDTKSLVTSINQIANALGKATDESESLMKILKSLGTMGTMDFNLVMDAGKKNNNMIAYGRAARKQVIPELESQIKYLEELFGGQQAVMNKLAANGSKVGFDVFTDFGDFNSDSAIKKMEAMEKYINSLKKLAAIDNVDLSGFNEIHKDATNLINDITGVESAVDKAGDVPEKIKNLFGSSVDGEKLSAQLDSIVADLGEIRTALQSLSSGVSLDGLTATFDRLSESIETLVKNAVLVKQTLGDGLDGMDTTIDGGSTERAIQDQKELAQVAAQTANVVEQSEEQIQQARKQFTDVGQFDDDTADAKELNAELKKLKDLAHQIGQLDFKIVKSDYNDEINQVREFERQLELLKKQYSETVKSLSSQGVDIGSIATPEFVEARNKIAELDAKIADTKAKLAKDIKIKLDAGDFSTQVTKINSDADKLSGVTDELQSQIRSLDTAMDSMNLADENGDIEGLISSWKDYKATLESVENQLKQLKIAQKDTNSADNLALDKELAMSRLKSLFGDGSEAAKKFATEINRIEKEINQCGNADGIRKINKEITNLGRQAEVASYKTETFGQKLKRQWQQYSAYFGVAEIFMWAEQGLRDMFEQVKLIDSAMTELKKVTDETDASYNQFLSNAASRAQEIGTTIDGLVSSTADFARLGYDFADAQGLAEVANIYAVVGDEIDGVEGATESLISTMAAFKDEMNGMSNSDFAMRIIDSFNELGNNFAISSGGIGEALERSASSLAAANNNLHESAALITAA